MPSSVPSSEPDAVLRYADRPDATIDVFLPDGPATGAVLLVHGGFWRERYDVTGTRPLGRALARAGWVAALPEYRRVGGGGDREGGWPTTCEDVAAAYDALPRLLATLDVRPARTVLVGHSAGGHLVLWLAGSGVAADGVVALAPVADLRDAVATRMGDGAATDFLGEHLVGTEVPAAADPAQLLERRPAYPVTVLHGTADEPVPLENSRLLVERHPWVALHELDGVDHMSMIEPAGPVHEQVLAALGDLAGT